ncbi:HigA family addiction module antitoxin [Methylocystis sp. JAN1]|uniref:HigA family addiction module antitoxin n=1 Tax=Methylocystis sp. JAN1 TaxID=3397211 RepID=UPI003FA2BAB4
MGRYREALTRLFLAGAFPASAGRVAPARPVVELAPVARARHVAAPRRVVAEPVQRAPAPRAARQRKFRPAPMEKDMTHPGRILARHLADLGMTASDLARDIDVPVNRVTAIINGQRGVTADTALRLGHWFGVDPEDWLELQLQYELALARHEIGGKISRLPRLVDRVS